MHVLKKSIITRGRLWCKHIFFRKFNFHIADWDDTCLLHVKITRKFWFIFFFVFKVSLSSSKQVTPCMAHHITLQGVRQSQKRTLLEFIRPHLKGDQTHNQSVSFHLTLCHQLSWPSVLCIVNLLTLTMHTLVPINFSYSHDSLKWLSGPPITIVLMSRATPQSNWHASSSCNCLLKVVLKCVGHTTA